MSYGVVTIYIESLIKVTTVFYLVQGLLLECLIWKVSFHRSNALRWNVSDNAPALLLAMKTLERQRLHSNAGALERLISPLFHSEHD